MSSLRERCAEFYILQDSGDEVIMRFLDWPMYHWVITGFVAFCNLVVSLGCFYTICSILFSNYRTRNNTFNLLVVSLLIPDCMNVRTYYRQDDWLPHDGTWIHVPMSEPNISPLASLNYLLSNRLLSPFWSQHTESSGAGSCRTFLGISTISTSFSIIFATFCSTAWLPGNSTGYWKSHAGFHEHECPPRKKRFAGWRWCMCLPCYLPSGV